MRAVTLVLAAATTFSTCTAAMANVGSHAYNRAISERRAEAVKAEMIRLGLREDQIAIVRDERRDPQAKLTAAKASPAHIELGH